MSKIIELRNKRNTLWEQTKAFLEEHRDENGLVKAEAVEQYNRMAADVKALGDEITRLEEQAEMDAKLSQPTSTPVHADPKDGKKKNVRPTATAEYNEAFWDMLRGRITNDALEGLSIGEDEKGGYTVPDEFERKLVEALEENKVKYNLKNVHAAILTKGDDGTFTYAKPVAIPGAVSLSLDAEGESSPFYADGIVYFRSSSNNGYSGDLELALIPEWFRTDILQEEKDSNGVLIERSDVTESVYFALLFEFDGDINAIRHVLYNCTVARPTIESSTKEASIEPGTETLSITADPREDGLVKSRTGDETTTATYNNWYKKGLFNFQWSLPSLKLPHFSWSWNDIGFGISIPSISVSWYKKAMDNPMILNNPTIFGAMGGKLLAGGEAGSEMVIGTQTLMETIRQAVAGLVSGNTNINYGGVTVNVYSQPGQDISELADEIEERINMNVAKRAAAFS